MKLFALVAFAITCVGLIGVGIRLLNAAHRTRTTPELVYGLAYLLGGASAFIRVTVRILGMQPEHWPLQMCGALLGAVATLCLLIGVRTIFRPDAGWAMALQIATAALIGFSLYLRVGLPIGQVETSLAQHLQSVGGLIAYAWGAVESGLYFRMMRRRLGLGLAEPIVVEQFRLWGASFACVTVAVSLASGVTWATGMGIAEYPGVLLTVQALLAVSATTTWLAFFPPQFYRGRIAARS